MFIEPVSSVFERLRQTYEDSDRFIFENRVISSEPGIATFYYVSGKAKADLGDDLPDWYDCLGSFNRDHILKHLGGVLEPYIVEAELPTTTLQALFEIHGIKSVDLLHIDTEGSDYMILSQFDFEEYRPEVVLYEYKHLSIDDQNSARALLKKFGYRLYDYKSDTLAIRRR